MQLQWQNKKWTQNWFADDSACAAKLPLLHDWFKKVCQLGPSYGYYPEPKKTVVVVDENDVDAANASFHDLGIKVVRCHRFLGGFIGDEEHAKRFVDEKVKDGMSHVMKLAKAAEHYPQAAYAALSKSMQFEWSFLQRVIPKCSASFLCLRDQINAIFWHAILDGYVSASELSLFTLPAHLGGMGINDPVDSA